MKKIITLLMVITMIFSLSACGEPSGRPHLRFLDISGLG